MVKDLVFGSLLSYFFPGYSLNGTERGTGVTEWHCSRVRLWRNVVFLMKYQKASRVSEDLSGLPSFFRAPKPRLQKISFRWFSIYVE